MRRERLARVEIDALADILWWIRGRLDAGEHRPFDESHIEALRKARVNAFADEDEAKDSARIAASSG